MIPTVTYDQVRIEQQSRLAHLERRRHAHEARASRAEKTRLHRVHPHVAQGRRVVALLGAILTASLVLFLI